MKTEEGIVISLDADKAVKESEPESKPSQESISESEQNLRFSLTDSLKSLEEFSDSESKLQQLLKWMEASLSRTGSPDFRSFWELKKHILDSFKETSPSPLRASLWKKYIEFSKEGRRLKEIFDERSAFAVEQIGKAIDALSYEIENFEDHITLTPAVLFPEPCNVLFSKKDYYYKLQRTLNLLNTQGARINAMRKELIKTDMRIKQKNAFFQQLSLLGDKVFPKRKEMIQEISDSFLCDVQKFIEDHFKVDSEQPFYLLRDEIKTLQAVAKILTLNSRVFSETRISLSECWDSLKEREKESRKQKNEKKDTCRENAAQVNEKIDQFHSEVKEGSFTSQQLIKKLDDILSLMRALELDRYDVKQLKKTIHDLKSSFQKEIDEERHEKIRQQEEIRSREVNSLFERLNTLIQSVDTLSFDQITEERKLIQASQSLSLLLKSEKNQWEQCLRKFKNAIADKKERMLLDLSDDDRKTLENLREVLRQREERRKEIKDQINSYRKASGGSGLGFDQLLTYQDQLNEEKDRLSELDQGIEEIQCKIRKLEEINI